MYPVVFKPFKSGAPYLEPAHAAEIYLDEQRLGSLGEIRASVMRSFKLPLTAAFEIDLGVLLNAPQATKTRKAFSRFPSVERDLTVKISSNATYQSVADAIHTALVSDDQLIFTFTPSSIYQKDADTKNLSFHLQFASLKQTLTGEQISAIMEKVTNQIQTLGAEVV